MDKFELNFAFGSHVETIEREKVVAALDALGVAPSGTILVTITGHVVVVKQHDNKTRVFEVIENA